MRKFTVYTELLNNNSMKLLKNRKGDCRPFNPWDQSIEPGDYLVRSDGVVFRAEESGGRDKRDSGELSMRTVKPPPEFRRGVLRGDNIYWIR